MRRVICCLYIVCAEAAVGIAQDGPDLVPLTYNDPDLVVDLGVGLWAHPVPMDYDGDGDFDLVVSCPDKPFNGTWFFENPDGNVKMPVFLPPVKVGPGYHSLRVSRVNDKTVVMTPARVFQDFPANQFRAPQKLKVPVKAMDARKTRANQWHQVDWDNDGDHDLLIGLGIWDDYGWDDAWDQSGTWTNGPLHGHVFVVLNEGTDSNPKWAAAEQLAAGNKPLDVYGWPSPCLADFDGDGDRDLICGEFVDRFTWFENTGTDSEIRLAAGKRVLTVDGTELQMDLQMIVPTAIDWDRDGDPDLIVGDEDGRVAFVENVSNNTVRNPNSPLFRAPVYFQQQADWLKFGALATPFAADWDGDGDTDILCGNTAGYISFFQNKGGAPVQWAAPQLLRAGGRTIRIMAGPNGSIQGPCESKWGYTTLSAADWDGDGTLDILANSIWGKVVWYRNSGRTENGLPVLEEAQSVNVEWRGATPKPEWTWWNPVGKELATQWRTTPEAVDFNRDGLTDLVMLDQEGYLSLFRRTKHKGRLVVLPPERIFVDAKGMPLQLNERKAGGSGRRKIHVVDWDGDGDFDLLTNSMNADFYENTGAKDGRVTLEHRGPIGKRKLAGHTSSPATIDLNGNGKLNLLVGAEDGHLYWRPE